MILAELRFYDWYHAFDVAMHGITAVVGDTEVSTDPFDLDDVVQIIDASPGRNDESDWLCVVALRDTRFAFVRAGCDNTGWG